MCQGACSSWPVQEVQWRSQADGRGQGAVQGREASEEPEPCQDGQGRPAILGVASLSSLQVYQSMAKAMDPHMLRAIGGMQGIESMMKQMQAVRMAG